MSTFRFRDQTYKYFSHPYNKAGMNSRTIEVPIALDYLKDYDRVLEVGNVLKHYYPELKHNVIDISPREKGAIRVDVMQWAPRQPYDLVISISTIEHIGYREFANAGDYTPVQAMEHLKTFLKPGGLLVVTVPLGFNPAVDEALAADALGPTWFMCRGDGNQWRACTKDEALVMPYHHWATATAFIEVQAPPYKMLNLGCGNRPIENYVNHDLTEHHDYVHIAWDLNILPWPWHDGQFKKVNARAVFEHLDIDLLTVMDEAWRILEPDGELYVKLPSVSQRCWDDPTHRRPYTLRTFNYFDPATPEGKQYTFYTERKWRIVKPAKLNNAKTSIICTLRKRP